MELFGPFQEKSLIKVLSQRSISNEKVFQWSQQLIVQLTEKCLEIGFIRPENILITSQDEAIFKFHEKGKDYEFSAPETLILEAAKRVKFEEYCGIQINLDKANVFSLGLTILYMLGRKIQRANDVFQKSKEEIEEFLINANEELVKAQIKAPGYGKDWDKPLQSGIKHLQKQINQIISQVLSLEMQFLLRNMLKVHVSFRSASSALIPYNFPTHPLKNFEVFHGGRINALKKVHQSHFLVSGGRDGSIHIFNTALKNIKICEIDRKKTAVSCIETDILREIIAVGYTDGKIYLFQLPNGETLKEILGHTREIHELFFSTEKNLLFSHSKADFIMITDLKNDIPNIFLKIAGITKISIVCISILDNMLLSGDDNGVLRIWDINLSQQLFEIQAENVPIRYARIFENWHFGVTIGNSMVKIWDLRYHTIYDYYDHPKKSKVDALIIHCQLIITANDCGVVTCYATRLKSIVFRSSIGDIIISMVLLDKRLFAACERSLRIFDIFSAVSETCLIRFNLIGKIDNMAVDSKYVYLGDTSGKITPHRYTTHTNKPQILMQKKLPSLVIETQDKQYKISSFDCNIKFWKGLVCLFDLYDTSEVTALACTSNNKYLLSGNDLGVLTIWNTFEQCAIGYHKAHFFYIQGISIAKNNFIAVTYGEDGVIKLWDIERNQLVKELDWTGKTKVSLKFTENNKYLVVADKELAKVWKV